MALLGSWTIIKILVIVFLISESELLQNSVKEALKEEHVLENLRLLRVWETLPNKFWDQPDQESLQERQDTVC